MEEEVKSLKEKYALSGWVKDCDTDEKLAFTKEGFIHEYDLVNKKFLCIDGNWKVNLRVTREE